MPPYKLISSDSHVTEPADLWQKRIDPKFRHRAPFLAHEEHGDQWYVDGNLKFGVPSNVQAGVRFDDPSRISLEGRYEGPHMRGLDPDSHVQDLDLDGVAGAVLYPSQGLSLYLVPDGELVSACFRAYNDYVAEFCRPYPDRLKGIGMINVDDVGDAVRELQRVARMGLAGVMIPIAPLDPPYTHPDYEPVWAACQDLALPISLHTGAIRATTFVDVIALNLDPVRMTNKEVKAREALAAMIFSGVFERYPKLKCGSVEFEVGWAPFFIERMDYYYKERPAGHRGYRFKGDALPSDFFHKNVFISFQEDELGMQLRHHIGVDNLLWGSDYPHAESTFPRSREIVERILTGVPHEEKVKIAGENAARVYQFE
jgi:predicted TIM-barrel fold metal-dependent hydrolase